MGNGGPGTTGDRRDRGGDDGRRSFRRQGRLFATEQGPRDSGGARSAQNRARCLAATAGGRGGEGRLKDGRFPAKQSRGRGRSNRAEGGGGRTEQMQGERGREFGFSF